MISQRSIQEVFEISQIEDVVKNYVHLKKRGANMIGLCPFHNEKTPSFTVSPSKNIFKCFGCGQGGNSVHFLMEHEKMNFVEAVRELAKMYRIELDEEEQTQEQVDLSLLKDSLYLVNGFANDFFKSQLYSDEGTVIALPYFKERGYLEQTIQKFELGYAPSNKEALKNAALKAQFKKESFLEVGLLTQSEIDFFRERVIFPVHSISGKIIAFGARTLSNNKKIPKYLNSPESQIYSKRNTLYGLFQAKKEIRIKDECFLVEGYTDVITLAQGGIENVVASSGTSLTSEQLRLIKRFTNHLTILFDGDPAGIKAAVRGLDIALDQDIDVKVVILGENEDPDSFFKKSGKNDFIEYVNSHKQDIILFKASQIDKSDLVDPVKKSDAIRDIISSVSRIKDVLKRSMYIQSCSKLLDVREDVLIKEVNKVIRKEIYEKKKKLGDTNDRKAASQEELDSEVLVKQERVSSVSLETLGDVHQEQDILRILLNYGNESFIDENEVVWRVIDYVKTNISDVIEFIDDELTGKLINQIFTIAKDSPAPNVQHFLAIEDSDIKDLILRLTTTPYEYSENWINRWQIPLQTQVEPQKNYKQDCIQSVFRFKFRKIQKLIKMNKVRIDSLLQDPDEVKLIHYLKVQKELQSKLKDVAGKLGTIVPS